MTDVPGFPPQRFKIFVHNNREPNKEPEIHDDVASFGIADGLFSLKEAQDGAVFFYEIKGRDFIVEPRP